MMKEGEKDPTISPHYDHVPLPQENWVEIDVIDGLLSAVTPDIRLDRERFRQTDYEWKHKESAGKQYFGSPATPIITASKNRRDISSTNLESSRDRD